MMNLGINSAGLYCVCVCGVGGAGRDVCAAKQLVLCNVCPCFVGVVQIYLAFDSVLACMCISEY